LARETGLEEQAVKDDQPAAEELARDIRVSTAVSDAPATAAWLSQVRNAEIAHDSVDQLSFLERTARSFQRGQAVNEQGRAGFDTLISMSPEAQERLRQQTEKLRALGDDATGAQGWVNSAAEVAGQIFDQLTSRAGVSGAAVGAAIGSVVPGPGTLAGAGIGFAAGQITDTFGTSIGQSLVELREAGVREDYAKALAVAAGTTIGAIEVVADRVGLGTLSNSVGLFRQRVLTEAVDFLTKKGIVPAAQAAGRAYVRNIAVQTGTEVVQEIVQIAAEEAGKVMTDPNMRSATPEEMADRIAEVAIKTFQATTILGAPGAIAGYRADRKAQQSAQANRDALDKVNQEISNGNLAQRDREAAVEHAATILPEVGIPADRFVEVLQQKQLTTLIDELGIGDRVEKAIEQGTDIRFTPEEHARLHLSEAGRDLLDHIRVDPNGLTFAESKEIGEAGIDQEVEAAAQPTAEEPPLTNTQRADLLKMGFTEQDLQGATAADYEALQGEGKLTKAQKNFLLALGFSKEQADAMNRAEFAQVQKLAPAGTLADPNNPSLAEAETLIGFQQLIRDAKNVGMTQQGYVSYLQAIAEAKQEAANRLERLRLKEEQARFEQTYKDAEDVQRQIARDEVNNRPVYAFLTAVSPTELFNRDSLVQALRDEASTLGRLGLALPADVAAFLNSLPKSYNKNDIYTTKADKKGGLPASYLAEKYGFDSVTEMVRALREAPNRVEEINARTDELMAQNHPDLVVKRTELDKAIEATHNNKAGGVLLQEVNALRREQGQGTLRYAVVKQAAAQRFAQMRLGEISPSRFFNAERRKAREAGQAIRKNDRRLAATRAFERLLNFEWARNAYRWQNEVKKDTKFIRAVFNADRSRAKGDLSEAADYFDAAKLVLIQNGLYEGDFDLSRISDEAQSLVDPNLMAQRSQATMTVGEWRTVIDEARRLVKAGQDASRVAVAGAEMELESLTQQLEDAASVLPDASGRSAEELAKGANIKNPVKVARLLARLGDTLGSQIEFLLKYMDNGKVDGLWQQAILGRFLKPAERKEQMRQEVTGLWRDLADLANKYEKNAFSVQGGITVVDAATGKPTGEPKVMTLRERAILAANMGNASNLDKTMRGYGATQQQLDAEIVVLPEEMRQWVQKMWDTFERFRPEVEAVYRSKMGKSPEMVRSVPLKFSDGKTTLRGGYFPLMYEREFLEVRDPSLAPTKASASGDLKGDFAQEVVFSGMTKERTTFAAPISLEVSRAALALDSVIHYVTMFDAVNDVKRVLRQRPVQAALTQKLGAGRYKAITDWVADVATDGDHQKLVSWQEDLSPIAEFLRKNVVVSAMTYSLSALMAQGQGFITAIPALGRNPDGTGSSISGAARFLTAFVKLYSSNFVKTAEEVRSKSALMRFRLQTAEQVIGEAIREAEQRRTKLDRVALAGFRGIGRSQFYSSDLPTWLAAYEIAKSSNLDEAASVRYADSLVRTTQGGGGDLFLSGAQRSRQPLMRLVNAFATYPTLLYNVLSENVTDVKRNPKAIVSVMGRMFWVVVLGSILDGLRQGQEPKEDEDPFYFWLKRMLATAVSAVPLAGDSLSSAVLGFRNPDSVMFTAISAADSIIKNGVGVMFGDKELSEAAPRLVKDFGILAGVPGSAQAARTLEALMSDDTEGFYDYIVGPPKK